MQIDSAFKNLKSAADVCPLCGYFIDLPELGDNVECNRCDFKCPIIDYKFKPIITTITFSEHKQWLEAYKISRGELILQEDKDQNTKAQIDQECPKCGHDRMHFWTVQIRSVDEGSTVFYECVKCKFRYQQHN